jgi:hypothetical protein
LPSRTWLTTPPGDEPVTDERADDHGERYVPALDLPREPRVPGRYRRIWVGAVAALALIMVAGAVVLIGEQAQQEDPSVPDVPGLEDPTLDEAEDGTLPQ